MTPIHSNFDCYYIHLSMLLFHFILFQPANIFYWILLAFIKWYLLFTVRHMYMYIVVCNNDSDQAISIRNIATCGTIENKTKQNGIKWNEYTLHV